jgi:hypothetical protein
MRLLDVLKQTQAHCAVLSASQASSGRGANEVAAMARFGFVRQDVARWFEENFCEPGLCHTSALAGLLVAYGLGVHTGAAYKGLLLSPSLGRLLAKWVDPIEHPEFALHRFKLTDSVPEDLDRPFPEDMTKAFHSDPIIWRYLGVYVDHDINTDFVDVVVSRMLTKQATTLIVSRVELQSCKEVFEQRNGAPMSFVGLFEGVGLYVYYNSDM